MKLTRSITAHGQHKIRQVSSRVLPTNMHPYVSPLRLWTVLLALVFSACVPAGESSAQPNSGGNPHALGIVGYNYTDRYIDQFYVDEQGGGNVDVSGEIGGGGGIVCCIAWRDGTPLPQTVHVRWVDGGCMKTLTDSDGYSFKVPSHRFKELDAQLTGPIPPKPAYFEVHFYPDGHVELAVTGAMSDPRVKLRADRQNPSYDNDCEQRAPALEASPLLSKGTNNDHQGR
jgi:hypothetical protein